MLVKDVPILGLLRNRIIVSHGCINAARTIETRRLWEHRLSCYHHAVAYIKLAESIDDAPEDVVMDFSGEDLPCLKN